MRKEDKGTIIAQIAETVKEYSCFYLAETATLNAEKTSNLRRACFKEGIKMMVVKNALLHKALEGLDTDYSPLYGSLKGSTTMFKSKNELIAEVIALLQSPAKNVVSALQSSGSTLHGVLQTLSER